MKKFMMVFGYGRWKAIQEASKMIGGKLYEKTKFEIRGFANSFIRSISIDFIVIVILYLLKSIFVKPGIERTQTVPP